MTTFTQSLRLRNNSRIEVSNTQSKLLLPKKTITFTCKKYPDCYKLLISDRKTLTYTFNYIEKLNKFYIYTVKTYLTLYGNL